MSQSGQIVIAAILTLAALISLLVALQAWRRGQTDARLFAVVMLSVVLWLTGYAAELALSSLTAKLYAARVEYIGFAVDRSGRPRGGSRTGTFHRPAALAR